MSAQSELVLVLSFSTTWRRTTFSRKKISKTNHIHGNEPLISVARKDTRYVIFFGIFISFLFLFPCLSISIFISILFPCLCLFLYYFYICGHKKYFSYPETWRALLRSILEQHGISARHLHSLLRLILVATFRRWWSIAGQRFWTLCSSLVLMVMMNKFHVNIMSIKLNIMCNYL